MSADTVWNVRRSALVAAFSLTTYAATASAALQSTDTKTVLVEPPRSARSLEDMWRSSNVVVVGIVSDEGSPTLRAGVVSRRQTVAVEQVIKDSKNAVSGNRLVILAPGGMLRQDDVEYRTNFVVEPLTQGDRVVLFLEPTKVGSDVLFEIRLSAGASLRTSDKTMNRITIRGAAASLQDFRDKPLTSIDAVVAQLRTYR